MLAAADFFLDLRAELFDVAFLDDVEAFFAFDDFVDVVVVVVVLDDPEVPDDPDVPLLGLNTCAVAGAASKQRTASQRIMA